MRRRPIWAALAVAALCAAARAQNMPQCWLIVPEMSLTDAPLGLADLAVSPPFSAGCGDRATALVVLWRPSGGAVGAQAEELSVHVPRLTAADAGALVVSAGVRLVTQLVAAGVVTVEAKGVLELTATSVADTIAVDAGGALELPVDSSIMLNANVTVDGVLRSVAVPASVPGGVRPNTQWIAGAGRVVAIGDGGLLAPPVGLSTVLDTSPNGVWRLNEGGVMRIVNGSVIVVSINSAELVNHGVVELARGGTFLISGRISGVFRSIDDARDNRIVASSSFSSVWLDGPTEFDCRFDCIGCELFFIPAVGGPLDVYFRRIFHVTDDLAGFVGQQGASITLHFDDLAVQASNLLLAHVSLVTATANILSDSLVRMQDVTWLTLGTTHLLPRSVIQAVQQLTHADFRVADGGVLIVENATIDGDPRLIYSSLLVEPGGTLYIAAGPSQLSFYNATINGTLTLAPDANVSFAGKLEIAEVDFCGATNGTASLSWVDELQKPIGVIRGDGRLWGDALNDQPKAISCKMMTPTSSMAETSSTTTAASTTTTPTSTSTATEMFFSAPGTEDLATFAPPEPVTTTTAQEDMSGPASNQIPLLPVVVGCAGGAVLLCGAVALLCVLNKRKSERKSGDTEFEYQSPPSELGAEPSRASAVDAGYGAADLSSLSESQSDSQYAHANLETLEN